MKATREAGGIGGKRPPTTLPNGRLPVGFVSPVKDSDSCALKEERERGGAPSKAKHNNERKRENRDPSLKLVTNHQLPLVASHYTRLGQHCSPEAQGKGARVRLAPHRLCKQARTKGANDRERREGVCLRKNVLEPVRGAAAVGETECQTGARGREKCTVGVVMEIAPL